MNVRTKPLMFPIALLTLAIFSVFGYAAGKVSRENTVIFDIDGGNIADPFNFNWMVPGTARQQGMHQCVWEPLFILNYETGEIEPWLGESFVADQSLKTWTLKIREGVTWADGEAFDADDIVFTIQTLLNDETQSLSDAANMQQWVDSIERIDGLTVQFNLKSPNPRFQLDHFSVKVWGGPIILPQHIWQGKDPFTFTFYNREKGWPFGTGAYKLVQATENEFTYDRRDTWWGNETGFMEMPVPKRLVWIVSGAEENTSFLAADGQLDSIMDITLGAFEAIQDMNPNIIAWRDQLPYAWPDPCPRQMSINHTVEPWNDPDMRRALSLMIDRQQVVEIAYEGTSSPTKTLFVEYVGMTPYINGLKDLWISPTADLIAGRALIEANGWVRNASGFYQKDGQELSLDIQTHEGFIEMRRIAEVVVEQLRAAGIMTTMRSVAGSTWSDNKAFGNFEAVIDWDACGSVNEPWYSMNRYTQQFLRPIDQRASGNNNFVRWSGVGAKTYSQLVAKIGVLPLGDSAIMPLMSEAMKIFMSEQVVIPITQSRKLVPFDTTYWVGWPTQKNDYNHPSTHWQMTHQIIHRLRKAGS